MLSRHHAESTPFESTPFESTLFESTITESMVIEMTPAKAARTEYSTLTHSAPAEAIAFPSPLQRNVNDTRQQDAGKRGNDGKAVRQRAALPSCNTLINVLHRRYLYPWLLMLSISF